MTDEERAAMFAERVAEYDKEYPGFAAEWASLCTELLRHGGKQVVPQPIEFLELLWLTDSGRDLDGKAEMRRGFNSACHQNSRALWARGVGDLWTGFALSDDGLWRQHSWVVKPDGGIVETTSLREAYWGVLEDNATVPDKEPDDRYWRVYTPEGNALLDPEMPDTCTECKMRPGVIILDDLGEEIVCASCLETLARQEEAERS